MLRRVIHLLPILALAACSGPRAGVTWYEARCIDQYGMQRGTPEFEACVAWDRRDVEETQARADRSRGGGP